MLTGGFVVHPGSIIKNYVVNSSGIVLAGGNIPGYFRWQFADIVNKKSINTSPFKKIAITISGYAGDYEGDRSMSLSIDMYKADKTLKGRLFTNDAGIYRTALRHVFDISGYNEQLYFCIIPYLPKETYVEYGQVTISKIEFLTS